MRLAATWPARLTKGLQTMGDQLRMPDTRGIVIPVALVAVLVGVLGTTMQLVYRAGLIVKGQEAQAAEWQSIKAKIEAVDELEGKLAQLSAEQARFQGFVTDWVRASTDEQIEQKSRSAAFEQELRRQERDRRLLQDYVEGRLGAMPYRPPSRTQGPQE